MILALRLQQLYLLRRGLLLTSDICVIIPAYNASSTINDVVRGALKYALRLPLLMMVLLTIQQLLHLKQAQKS